MAVIIVYKEYWPKESVYNNNMGLRGMNLKSIERSGRERGVYFNYSQATKRQYKSAFETFPLTSTGELCLFIHQNFTYQYLQ